MNILGITVDDALVAQWKDWLAPSVQGFFVESRRGLPKSLDGAFTAETSDTFRIWHPRHRDKLVVWYDEATYTSVRSDRKERVVRAGPLLWPTQATPSAVRSFVESENIASHHRAVDWERCRQIVPRAHDLAGRYPPGSGPNCFGAVMGAAGVIGAEDEWMQVAPFSDWLASACRRGGNDDEPGTVLVWRDTAMGRPFHAAITLGDGWAFEKSSQCWWSPRYVASVVDVKRSTRMNGIRLERWRLAGNG